MVKQEIDLQIDERNFNEAYFPHVIDYSHRYNVYYGGRCSGKSYFISDKLLIKGLSDKRRMLFLMKEGNKVEDTIWRLFLDSIHKFQLYNQCKINKSNHTIELPNGTWVKMTGMDDPEKAKGYVDIDTVWFEECTKFNIEDIDLVDGTLRGKKKNKEIYFSFNPVDKSNWVYKYFGFDTGVVPPDTFILKTTYKDNKWCTEAEIKRLERLKERNPARYKIEAEGDFATLDKLVIPHYNIEEFDWQEKLNEDKGDKRFLALGSDFGYQDPTTLICSVVDDKNKKLYIYDEHYERGMLNTDIARMIISKNLRKEKIFFDCAEPKSIQELRKLGIERATPCKKGKDSIKHGLQKLLQYEIIVHPKCTHVIDEFNNYCYKKSKQTGEYTNEPLDNGFCHCIDALRYSLQIIKKQAKVLTIKL
ncbi:PBSX family phage terminase large subunit [Cellulosilyticum sp. I15G10I2]|uniref:PBSX family phage terminase large subunit n=1 Tax=Cellulosilyticum sp. I15G10I2 TaxID=1892843 RepID=UPI00085BDF50|nr:PBSX family phage terminase large subunit [Cellulosilyticum sp. I15G10I2]